MGRRTVLRRLTYAVLILVGLAVAAFAVSLLARARSTENRTRPARRMAGCPETPNCVSSVAGEAEHGIEPLPFDAEPAAAWRRARGVVEALPRTEVVVSEPGYLAAECSSRLFGFVDDLELALDADASVIHVRSASRVGHSDLGVNRRRVERVRELFETPGKAGESSAARTIKPARP